jgi:hypothetical protein
MKMKLIVLILSVALFLSPVWGASLEVKLAPVGSAEGIFNRPDLSAGALAQAPVMLHLTIRGADAAATTATVSWAVQDIFRQPVNGKEQLSVDLKNGQGEQDISFRAPGPGYFQVQAEAQAGADTATVLSDFGMVPSPYPGVRPNSFFATNTSGLRTGADLDLLQAIGMKVERGHFYPRVGKVEGLAPGQAPSLDFTQQDKDWAETKARGIWMLPIIGYALEGDRSRLALATGMYGPPGDEERFANTWAAIFRHHPEITTAEFWNEPWIFGWTFAGTPGDYDRLQKLTCEKLLAQNPRLRLIAGNSTAFVVDNMEPAPSCWRDILQGITEHPYTGDVSGPNFRDGSNLRAIDETGLVARRMKLPYAYLTEGGTQYSTPVSGPEDKRSPNELANNVENASKVVQYYVKTALDGLFQGDAQWQIGYGDGWTRANVTFAVMTHFLEDRPAVADIWPANELIWGGIFANPKFATAQVKALPRAKELAARWKVAVPEDRAGDKTKVAVIWSLTGESNDKLDPAGTLTISPADGLRAWDMTGREILAGKDGLTVPFTAAPVYVTSETLSVTELRDRVAKGVIQNVTPVNLYALSLADDPAQAQTLSVRMENQLNVPLQGTLHVKVNGSDVQTSAPFSIPAAKLAEVAVPWPSGVAANANNQYGITLTAEVAPAGNASGPASPALPVIVSRQQIASVARFAKRTIALNGSEDDWKGVMPVLLDSSLLNPATDVSQYLLNPDLEKSTGDAGAARVVARVYTAYDQDNVYLGAAVHEDTFQCRAGEPAQAGRKKFTTAYKRGMPDGLDYVTSAGDVFQFSFGFRDRVPGVGRQMEDPYAWKGDFYDVDYSYVAHGSTEGDKLFRLWGADTARRNGYQTEAVPGQGPVRGGKIKITRDEAAKVTLYELAIPRSELKLFQPEAGRCRFGFVLYTSGKVGSGEGLNWSDAAGVFDHWRNQGSFPPTWTQHTACQTFFGIEK